MKKPAARAKGKIEVRTYSPVITGGDRVLYSTQAAPEMIETDNSIDLYTASQRIAENYYLDQMRILNLLKGIYDNEVPLAHLEDLFIQVESQTNKYTVSEEIIEEALALIRLKNRDGNDNFMIEDDHYYAEIRYTKDKKGYLVHKIDKEETNQKDFGFHYTPYNFDSNPEKDFFDQLLVWLNENPEDVQDIYFTGAITDPEKTDFYFEYKGADSNYHLYYPDFVIRLKNGKYYIVEIKRESDRQDPIDGENGAKQMVLKELEEINKDQFKYEIIFAGAGTIPANKLNDVKSFSGGK